MPLPPSSSRAHATVSRHLAVQNALASAACASVNLPSACSCAWRTIRHCEAVMFAIILASRSCTSWNDPNVLQRDVTVLDDLERNLVLDLLDAEAGRRLVLDDEALDLVVGDIARPDDRDVAPRGVADPALLAVQHPGVAVALCRGRQATGRSRADQGLGQAEASDLLEARHG